MYKKEEKLRLVKQIAVTKKVYKILRRAKKLEGVSMAKIVCNLVIENYGKKKKIL